MQERPPWVQKDFLRRGSFAKTKEPPVVAYFPETEQGPDDPFPNTYPKQIKIPRTGILYQNSDYLIARVGEEREIVIFDKYQSKQCRYLYRGKEKVIEGDFWNLNRGRTIFPERIKDLRVIEGEQLDHASLDEIGGKAMGQAMGLVKLKHWESLGFKVPNFMVIPTSFYHFLDNLVGFEGRAEEIISAYTIEEIMSDGQIDHNSRNVPFAITQMFEKLSVYQNFEPVLRDKIFKICGWFYWKHWAERKGLYFRSSFPLEDGDKYSFAGVFESCLVRDEDEIADAVKRVLLSPWTAYSEYYLRQQGLVGKTSRAMAIIVQEVPPGIRFTGRIFSENEQLDIEYVEGVPEYGNYFGQRIILDRHLDIIAKKTAEGPIPWKKQNAVLPEEDIKKLARLTLDLERELKISGRFNLEFVLDDKTIYLLQIRPTIRKREEAVVDFKGIKNEDIIGECYFAQTEFSFGRVEGPAINLLSVAYGEINDELLSFLDRKYPGAIYLVWPGTGQKLRPQDGSIEALRGMDDTSYLYTHRKKGIVICAGEEEVHHDHFTEQLKNEFLIYASESLIAGIATGTRIGIVSNGKKAVFYRCSNQPQEEVSLGDVAENKSKKGYDKSIYGQMKLPNL